MPPDGLMPPGAMPGSAPPGAPPGAGGMPPPTGPTGATMPIANQGIEMKAMAKLGELAQAIQMILAVLPVGSDVSGDVSDALNKIRKHLKPGAEQSGTSMTEKQLEAMQQRQMGPQIASMRAGAGGPPPGAAPPVAPPTP